MLSPSSSTTTKNIYDIGSIELRESYIEPGIPFAAGTSTIDSDSIHRRTSYNSLNYRSSHQSIPPTYLQKDNEIMPRGAEYDNGIPQSDNAIEAGETKVHGTNSANDHLDRVNRTADLPDVPAGGMHSGGGAPGHSSGKGGHEPRTLGENKGLGAHKA
ncbi:hypothetical protein LV164_003800 [Aspergillus fumigatus]|nr:hypothetical protein KXX32_000565 [Aspergillus fumigatus]KAH1497689.1 hypothetical protein KXX42_002285 [Aspergillus fumigatus]KAH1554409.1 hypothetical protein KXX57_005723 [Aspergillus fumigatus]KAH1906644.1 hypothetical protein KXV57_005269 [Aspergillus fumigatus]KAH1984998.1 hypothetical protein KXW88_001148 [Aspergillus fumigatus]